MHRFFIEDESIWEKSLTIQNKELLNQIIKVLRSNIWDNFIFFDWKKSVDYIYELKGFDKKNLFLLLKDIIEKENLECNINLYQSIPNKINKIELILQKWVEVWYSSFVFFKSMRSQKINISDNKLNRFKKIIIEACEQSWRNTIPDIYFLDSLDISEIKWQNLYFHTENQKTNKLSNLKFEKNINIFVWPEGGFTTEETSIFDKNNFTKVFLGPNILRTETTSIVVWFYIRQTFLK